MKKRCDAEPCFSRALGVECTAFNTYAILDPGTSAETSTWVHAVMCAPCADNQLELRKLQMCGLCQACGAILTYKPAPYVVCQACFESVRKTPEYMAEHNVARKSAPGIMHHWDGCARDAGGCLCLDDELNSDAMVVYFEMTRAVLRVRARRRRDVGAASASPKVSLSDVRSDLAARFAHPMCRTARDEYAVAVVSGVMPLGAAVWFVDTRADYIIMCDDLHRLESPHTLFVMARVGSGTYVASVGGIEPAHHEFLACGNKTFIF